MDFRFNETQRLLKETTSQFASEKIPNSVARENDIHERFPLEIVKEMGELGLFGGPIPSRYGGADLDYISYAIINEEISKACSSVRTVLSVQISLVASTILKWGSEKQKNLYLPKLCSVENFGCFALTEPDAGSDAQHIKTFAKKTQDGWVLNGNKTWISNGGVADIALVIAQTEKEDPRRMTAFLVETQIDGFSTKDIHGKLGLRSSNTAQIFMKNVEIQEDAILGEVGDGFKIAMSALDNGRYSVAAGCLGIAKASLESSVSFSKERHTFGKPIGAHQLVQDLIAQMVVDVEASRLLLYKAGELKNAGEKNTRETSIAKFYCSESALKAANHAIQIHGGMGYSNEYPVERYMRDARIATIYEGTSQIQKLIIAGFETGIRSIS